MSHHRAPTPHIENPGTRPELRTYSIGDIPEVAAALRRVMSNIGDRISTEEFSLDEDTRAAANHYLDLLPEDQRAGEVAYGRVSPVRGLRYMPGVYLGRTRYGKPSYSGAVLALQLDEDVQVDVYRPVRRMMQGAQLSSKRKALLANNLPDSMRIIGYSNGVEVIYPPDFAGWLQRSGIENNAAVDHPYVVQAKKAQPALQPPETLPEADEHVEVDGGILNIPDEGIYVEPKGESESDNSDVYDSERMKALKDIRDEWGGAYMVRAFATDLHGKKNVYHAVILPEVVGGKQVEWAIADNEKVGNALFIVDPVKLQGEKTWRDVLMEKSKGQAVQEGALRIVHDPVGMWKHKVLEVITAPSR